MYGAANKKAAELGGGAATGRGSSVVLSIKQPAAASKPKWDRKGFQLNQANLLAEALPNFPPNHKPICIRDIIRLAKAALNPEGAA